MRGKLLEFPTRGVSLYVKTIGIGCPLLLMHGGPGADHSTLSAMIKCRDAFQLIFYDHRCNGRSRGAHMEWLPKSMRCVSQVSAASLQRGDITRRAANHNVEIGKSIPS
jgi:pimeloyl-ACP methyl ester carboxylesterase